jgi:hypothetical protein
VFPVIFMSSNSACSITTAGATAACRAVPTSPEVIDSDTTTRSFPTAFPAATAVPVTASTRNPSATSRSRSNESDGERGKAPTTKSACRCVAQVSAARKSALPFAFNATPTFSPTNAPTRRPGAVCPTICVPCS